jgi:hypothetical protein
VKRGLDLIHAPLEKLALIVHTPFEKLALIVHTPLDELVHTLEKLALVLSPLFGRLARELLKPYGSVFWQLKAGGKGTLAMCA